MENKLNQVIPYLWGMVIIINIISILYFPSILMGIFLGFSIGMLIESIFYNILWGLIGNYRILSEKLLNLKVRK